MIYLEVKKNVGIWKLIIEGPMFAKINFNDIPLKLRHMYFDFYLQFYFEMSRKKNFYVQRNIS